MEEFRAGVADLNERKFGSVDGHPVEVKALAEDFAACRGFPKISPFYERCQANKTMGYEIGETLLKNALEEQSRLGGRGFDFYLQTLCAGMGLIGFHMAMEDLCRWTDGESPFPESPLSRSPSLLRFKKPGTTDWSMWERGCRRRTSPDTRSSSLPSGPQTSQNITRTSVECSRLRMAYSTR